MKLQAKIDQHTTSDLPKQHVYYLSGIGTRPKPLNIFDRMKGAVSDLIDQAVAWLVPVKCVSLLIISLTTGIWGRL